jgi:hypothetical protein
LAIFGGVTPALPTGRRQESPRRLQSIMPAEQNFLTGTLPQRTMRGSAHVRFVGGMVAA